jgi:hypothetical protein
MTAEPTMTNEFTNTSPYSFAPTGSSSLKFGNWITPPQPIAIGATDFVAFEAGGMGGGTVTGAVGVAVYDVMSNGNNVGRLSLSFSDPFDGSNSASATTTVAGLVVSCHVPPQGDRITAKWKAE